MQKGYDLTQAQMSDVQMTSEYVLDNGGEWRIGFYSEQGMGSVWLNAETGMVEEAHFDSAAASNG